jgi:UPF0716 protein FxsA
VLFATQPSCRIGEYRLPRTYSAETGFSIRRALRQGCSISQEIVFCSRERGTRLLVCGVLAFLFIGVPALEIYVLIKVGGLLGALPTLGIIVATGVAGAALAKHQGLAAVKQGQGAISSGDRVGSSLVEAALVLAAGLLMLTPGFITDVVGLSLLVPPVRALIAARIVKWGAARVSASTVVMGDMGDPRFGPGWSEDDEDDPPPPPGVIDV